jgi:hypothetical protein
MSVYNARRAPNVSQYIDELNQVPSSFDLSQQQPGPEDFDFEGSLAMFTNAEFPDFDVGDNGNDSIPFIDPALDGRSGKDNTTTTGNGGLTDFPLFNSKFTIILPLFCSFPDCISQLGRYRPLFRFPIQSKYPSSSTQCLIVIALNPCSSLMHLPTHSPALSNHGVFETHVFPGLEGVTPYPVT